MPNQLPGPSEVFLDHTAFFVPAMDAASDVLERCGFRLTPFTLQTNRQGEVRLCGREAGAGLVPGLAHCPGRGIWSPHAAR